MSGRRDIILVVDDSSESLGFLTRALEQADFTALVARDGAGALDLLENVTPDLVLMDAVMPRMDGFETCRRIKAGRRTTHLPVIFMTGLSETQHVVEGLNAGGVDYVTKPIVIDELLVRIRVHLSNARISHGARAALDVTGRFLIATNDAGELSWSTSQADALLGTAFPDREIQQDGLPLDVSGRLAALIGHARAQMSEPVRAGNGKRLNFLFVGATEPNEYLFRLTEEAPNDGDLLQARLGLTQREAEVLIWIAGGKPNRDIGEILGISPRTVNKHLEQIFTKLGVENRASAAAQATRILAARNWH
jgi:DNA-binding response OmpR family regulator/DNA-binding CsgD family transcriptional regulator